MALLDRARALDDRDPLAAFRGRFSLDPELVYLDGNSLGPPVRSFVEGGAQRFIEEWNRDLVQGWDRWIDLGLETGDLLAPLIGAGPGEVAVTDQTSVNLYKLATAAVGGAMHDGSQITAIAKRSGATVLWDLAHSAGAVLVDLAAWGADLAVGCTYKYLNGGPGAPGFLYVRSDVQASLRQPIEAWFGHADQFGFHPTFEPAASVRRFQTGTPPILSLEAARAGIEVTCEAGMPSVRAKSVSLSELFLDALDTRTDIDADVVSPRDHAHRGSHVAVAHRHALPISSALRAERVIVDYRTPDVIRFGFAPLYTTHHEVVQAVDVLAAILDQESWRDHAGPRSGVT